MFGIIAMLGFGLQNFFTIGLARRLGGFRSGTWIEILVLIIVLCLAVFFFRYTAITLEEVLAIVAAGFASAVAIFALNKGFQAGNASVVVTISGAWGLVTALLGILLLGQGITYIEAFAIGLIVIGTLLVSLNLRSHMPGSRAGGLGVNYALVSLLGFGAFYFLLDLVVKSIGWFPATVLILIPVVLFLLLFGRLTKNKLVIPRHDLPMFLFIALLNLAGFVAYNLGVSYSFSIALAPITAANPVIVVLLAYIVLKERLGRNQLVGIAMVLIGLISLSI